jgi:hypothetical protein
VGEKEIVEGGPAVSTGTGGGATTGGSTAGGGLVDPMPQGGGGGKPGGPQTATGGGPQTVERGDPCKDLTDKAQELLKALQSAHDENRAAMQRALSAFFGPKSSEYNEGYAHSLSMAKITEAVVDANNATGKALIDVALFAAGGWGGLAGKGSTAAGILGEGLAGAKTAAEAWGKVGVKVASKVADAYIGNKAGTMGAGTYKFLEKAMGEQGADAGKAFQGPAGAIESIVRGAIIDALGNWMKDGATSGDLSRAQAAYADFVAGAAVANTTAAAADDLKKQIDDLNEQLRARNCPEVTIPDYVFYTFDLTQFGNGMFRSEKGPQMHAKNLVSGGDRTTDLFAKVNDVGSLPF